MRVSASRCATTPVLGTVGGVLLADLARILTDATTVLAHASTSLLERLGVRTTASSMADLLLVLCVASVPFLLLAKSSASESTRGGTPQRMTSSRRTRSSFYLGKLKTRRSLAHPGAAPTGFKAASLVLEGGELALLPLVHDAPYRAIAQAQCLNERALKGPEHSSQDCTCGFYAYKDLSAAREHPQLAPWSVLLEVVLSGEVHEHARGFRASTQRVKHVLLRSCASCPLPATALRVTAQRVLPTCAEHLPASASDVITVATASKALSAQALGYGAVEVTSAGSALTDADVTAHCASS